jgi:hypothetical protein
VPPFPFPCQNLELDLRASYSNKNFTLRAALLELEKRYRSTIDADEAVAALWADVASLLVGAGGKRAAWGASTDGGAAGGQLGAGRR